MKKLTFGQILTLGSALGGLIPLFADLVTKGTEAFQICAGALAAPYAVGLLIVSTVSGVFSKSFIETLKGK